MKKRKKFVKTVQGEQEVKKVPSAELLLLSFQYDTCLFKNTLLSICECDVDVL